MSAQDVEVFSHFFFLSVSWVCVALSPLDLLLALSCKQTGVSGYEVRPLH